MSLSPGSRLGPYHVLGPLGAGGMGEVYRARDSRLGREVRIKVADPDMESTQTRTEPGTVLGTVGDMSPEQVRGQPTDARSDIFSFGCLLYELATGVRAFDAPSAAEIRAAILRDEPGPAGAGGHPIPTDLSRLIAHCLEKNPDVRFQSARDLAFDLRPVLNAAVTAKTISSDPGSIEAATRAAALSDRGSREDPRFQELLRAVGLQGNRGDSEGDAWLAKRSVSR
jgi:serine/threonine protein kinase